MDTHTQIETESSRLVKDRKNRRRSLFVDRQFQLDFLKAYLLVFGLLAASFLGFNALFVWRAQRASQQIDLLRLALLNAIPITLIGVGMGLYAMFQTHRIAGPLLRIQRVLQSLIAGDYSQRIRLRQGDSLQTIAHSLDRLALCLRERREGLLSELARLEILIDALETDSDDLPSIRESLEELRCLVEGGKAP